MATAAFKSTTKRTSVGRSSSDESASSNSNSSVHHRRSRSLSRFSRPLSSHDESSDAVAPRGKFVNTVRGSGFPEISLDDLAVEFFESANRGRSGSRSFDSERTAAGEAASRRGRSVSRKSNGNDDRRNSIGGGGRPASDTNSRRRRSVSVVRYQISDSESDHRSQNSASHVNTKNSDSGNRMMNKSIPSDQRPVLRKSLSQKDLRSYDGYSSQSSVLTDDEGAVVHFNKNGTAKLQAVYAQKKAALPDMDNGLHKAMRKELKHMENEQAVVKPRSSTSSSGDRLMSKNSDVIQDVSSFRRNYETELEQSEKRKQDLLAEIVFEDQRGRELSKIVNELIPATKNNSLQSQKPLRARKRSNDRSRMSMCLTEEAEKYIEDFLSNVEDTDISSLDGERSDTSSSIGGLMKPETYNSPPMPRSLPILMDGGERSDTSSSIVGLMKPETSNNPPMPLPVLMDGVTLPWLQWETSNDASPTTSLPMTSTPKTASSTQEIAKAQDQSYPSVSSRGSWSPDILKEYVGKDVYSKLGESYCCPNQSLSAKITGMGYDMDEYLKVRSDEDFLLERWKQQHRINSGSLLLCNLKLF